MLLRDWANQFASIEPADSEWDWRENRAEFSRRIGDLAKSDDALGLTAAQWDRIAETAAWTSATVLWDKEEASDSRLVLLSRLEALVEKTARLAPVHSYGVGMFWDVIAIRARPLSAGALPHVAIEREYESPAVAEALYRALARQLLLPNKQVQMSALRGLSQLGDRRTPQLIRAESSKLFDEEVRSMAARAARFELI